MPLLAAIKFFKPFVFIGIIVLGLINKESKSHKKSPATGALASTKERLNHTETPIGQWLEAKNKTVRKKNYE